MNHSIPYFSPWFVHTLWEASLQGPGPLVSLLVARLPEPLNGFRWRKDHRIVLDRSIAQTWDMMKSSEMSPLKKKRKCCQPIYNKTNKTTSLLYPLPPVWFVNFRRLELWPAPWASSARLQMDPHRPPVVHRSEALRGPLQDSPGKLGGWNFRSSLWKKKRLWAAGLNEKSSMWCFWTSSRYWGWKSIQGWRIWMPLCLLWMQNDTHGPRWPRVHYDTSMNHSDHSNIYVEPYRIRANEEHVQTTSPTWIYHLL